MSRTSFGRALAEEWIKIPAPGTNPLREHHIDRQRDLAALADAHFERVLSPILDEIGEGPNLNMEIDDEEWDRLFGERWKPKLRKWIAGHLLDATKEALFDVDAAEVTYDEIENAAFECYQQGVLFAVHNLRAALGKEPE